MRGLVLAVAMALATPAAVALAATSQASPRIVHGIETADYPTVGAVLHAYGDLVTQHNAELLCSGVLVGCRTFLTAAHCLQTIPVFDDRHDLAAPGRLAVYLPHAGFLPVSEVLIHPDYEGEFAHDLAILRLAAPVEGIEPSPINSTHDLEAIGTGLDGTIVGFGRGGVDSDDWGHELGIKRVGSVVTASCDPYYDDDELVCWNSGSAEDSNIADGDIGGPMFLEFDGSLELAGVAVDTYRDLSPIYSSSRAVDVAAHADWLEEQLESDSTSACGEVPLVGSALAPVRTELSWVGPSRPKRTFRIPVRDDTTRVIVTMNAGSDYIFDADLFVKVGAEASETSFDCASVGESLFAACDLESPGAGYVSVLVAATTRYSGRFQLTVVEQNQEVSECGNATREIDEQCDGNDLGDCPVGPCGNGCTCPEAACGNGALEDGEDCDDGDTEAGDGCDAACVPETPDTCEQAPLLDLSLGFAAVRGDTTGLGDSHVFCGGKAGDAWYRFSLAEPAVVSAETDGAFESVLSIYQGDCSGYFRRGCNSDSGVGPGSSVHHMELEAGEYILIVDGRELSEGPFELTISATEPGCGNGVTEEGRFEECDGLDHDYCDAGVCGSNCRCAPSSCGNDVREQYEQYEQCDGSDLGRCDAGPCGEDCSCPEPQCGNGIAEDPEDCDGLDQLSYFCLSCDDDCRCRIPFCGDGARDAYEECEGEDLGICKTGPCAADCTCPDSICGNGLREPGESCDGSELGACPTGPCRYNCTCPVPVCGNGIREQNESCDGEDDSSCSTDGCDDDCTCTDPVCGNGMREGPERCDGEGESFCPTGTCTDQCLCPEPVCGNDVRETGETCDGADDGGCFVGPCQQDCQCPAPVCGNGILEFLEDCDNPNLDLCDNGPCTSDCTCPPAECGNDVREDEERCDGADLGRCVTGPCGDDCSCPEPVCGNDVREEGEHCDGPQAWFCSTGSCENDCTCTPAVCGDGIRHFPEDCDGESKGLCIAGPCQNDCTCPLPVCGNGIFEGSEDCDGPELGYCKTGPCTEACECPAPVCGNDILEQGETCDGVRLASCLVGPCGIDCECPAPVCGNSVIEAEEICDGTKRGDCIAGPCDSDCTCPAPVCGNNVIEAEETCDAFNPGSCPAGPCDPDCTCPAPVCGNDAVEFGESCDGTDSGFCEHGPCQDDCTCAPVLCGDGYWDEPGEVCDPSSWDPEGNCSFGTCEPDCTCPLPVCGNGEVEGNEQCDGEEDDGADCQVGCGEDCRCLPYCGDYTVNGDEQCESYHAELCASQICNNDCTCRAVVCGDSIILGDEECDGEDLGSCPLGPCSNRCRCPEATCGNDVLENEESCEASDTGVCGRPCNTDCTCEAALACDDATVLPSVLDAYESSDSNVGASSDSVGCGGPAGDRWYSLHIDRHSILEASAVTVFWSELSLFEGGCDSLAFLRCNDFSHPYEPRVGPTVLKPGNYFLVFDGKWSESDEGDFTLHVDVQPWNCGDADDNGTITASDALRALRKGVGLPQECPVQRCDASGDGDVSASDALTVLRTAVGVVMDLYCPRGL